MAPQSSTRNGAKTSVTPPGMRTRARSKPAPLLPISSQSDNVYRERKARLSNMNTQDHQTSSSSHQTTNPKTATNRVFEFVGSEAKPTPPRKRKADHFDKEPAVEKRLKKYRPHPPQAYRNIEERALTQRFCVLERRRTGTDAEPEETVEIAGTTGNIYTVKIKRVPSCDCPHARKGNQCKHIIYIMKRTLHAPDHLAYQLALLSTELQEVLANAPPIPTDVGKADAQSAADEDPRRKPVADDCPICCMEFEPATEKIVWCKAGCGNNVHRDCFQTWAKMKKSQGATVTCPFCRMAWQEDELQAVDKSGAVVGPEGYRNVAESLGLTGIRDYSTYHPFWVASHIGDMEDESDYENEYDDY